MYPTLVIIFVALKETTKEAYFIGDNVTVSPAIRLAPLEGEHQSMPRKDVGEVEAGIGPHSSLAPNTILCAPGTERISRLWKPLPPLPVVISSEERTDCRSLGKPGESGVRIESGHNSSLTV